MTQPLFQDIFSKIDTATIQEKHQESNVFLHFGHSSGVLPLISALELYNDERDLLASDWSNDRRDHKWKISDIGTFGANIGVALYQGYEDGGSQPSALKIMLLHNEHVVKQQPACGEELCTVQDFKRKYQHIMDLDFDRECGVSGTHTGISNSDHEYEAEWNSGAKVTEETEVSSEDEDDSDEDSDSNSDEDSSSEEDD